MHMTPEHVVSTYGASRVLLTSQAHFDCHTVVIKGFCVAANRQDIGHQGFAMQTKPKALPSVVFA